MATLISELLFQRNINVNELLEKLFQAMKEHGSKNAGGFWEIGNI